MQQNLDRYILGKRVLPQKKSDQDNYKKSIKIITMLTALNVTNMNLHCIVSSVQLLQTRCYVNHT